MAIITDPDLLSRFSTIFGTNEQKVSIYPVGDTQRGSNAYAAWVSNTSTVTSATGTWTSVANGDVVCIMIGPDAGHYYVNNALSTSVVRVGDIDSGTSGAAVTSLNVDDDTIESVSAAANTLTLTAHTYVTGDAVVFDDGGGTAPAGLTDLTVYYTIRVDANTIKLASSYANALAGTEIDITTAGTGTFVLHKRLIVSVFTNGASASEQIGGNPTSGAGDGDVLDGATLQSLYSFAKEEWRTDSLVSGMSGSYNDDLIRHQFPFEAITSEQFEIGGGASHDNWNWFNNYTRKKVRTAGWAEKTTTSAINDLARETGIVTLGFLESDTQVYYQQTSATTVPVDFTFLGAVNEAIRIYYDANQDGSADDNFTTYLKLFARKKGLTYTQSTIADIGVSTIQTIVNRFPLAHATDTAIVSTDGQILGTSPYRAASVVTLADTIDGSKTIGGFTFTDADQTFQTAGVVAGDTLRITSGTEQGYYTIASVDSETALTIVPDFEMSTGWASSESGLTYSVYSYYKVALKSAGTAAVRTAGVLANVDGATGTITEAGQFGSVAVGDILWITEAPYQGLYRVTSIAGAPNAITVNTGDTIFGAATVDYMILSAGMYLQYKKTTVTNTAPASYAFNASNGTYGGRPTITRADGTFDASIAAGTIVEITSSENSGENDGSYTVYARETATILSLVPTDVLITNATDTTAVAAIWEGFKRTIGSGTYAFNWKVTGNGAGLSSIYQFIQHQLRQSTDIDYGGGTARGDITDLLMSFASPTGTGINTYFDNLDTNDINNLTLQDHSGTNRNFPFVAAGALQFNTNLTSDSNAKYWLFFSNDDAGDNLGRDYGTKDAIIVQDSNDVEIAGNISAQASIAFTYYYDGNVQRGATSAATTAPVTLVAIGLDTAQFVISTGTISRTTGITISAVAALERNYLNPV